MKKVGHTPHFLPFCSLEMSLFYIRVLKIMIIWSMLPEIKSATDIIFCHFGPNFALLPHYWPQKLKFAKNVQKASRYYLFTHVYHKWKSCDVWFLRCQVQQTEFFVILGHFLPFYFTPLTIQKIKILKKWKKLLEISWFYTSVSKIMIISYTIPEIWRMTDVIVNFHFGIFFALSVKA